jgi:hypothetical protein
MAIDSADKRRNVSRMMLHAVMGLSPSAGVDTADRVNAARAYVGFSYTGAPVVREFIRFQMSPTRGKLLKVK